MDNAWEYHDGESEKRMGQALAGGRRDKAFLMTKVCSHGRGKQVALRQLHESLRRLRTDHLDLWQIHEVVYENDPERHFARDGAVEALDEAQAPGQGALRRVHRAQGPVDAPRDAQARVPVRRLPAPAQLLRRGVPQLRAAGPAGAGSGAGSRPWA